MCAFYTYRSFKMNDSFIMDNMSNFSTNFSNMSDMNTTMGPDRESCVSRTQVWVQVIGAILFFLVWPFVVLDMKWFPLGRPAAALVGACLMVIFQIVGQFEVYEIEGSMGNLQAVFLLIGMMLLSYYFDREGLLQMIALWIFGKNKDRKFAFILWKVCALAAVLAAFITNDATSLVLTPLLLKEFNRQGRSRKEILPLCLGIATSANIGSASTVFGNPQNAFIASAAENVSLVHFFIALLPSAIIGICISVGLLYLIFFRTIFLNKKVDDEEAKAEVTDDETHEMEAYAGTLDEERKQRALSYDRSADPYQTSSMAVEREVMYSSENLAQSGSMDNIPKSRSRQSLRQGGSEKPSASNPNLTVPGSQDVPAIKVDGETETAQADETKAVAEQDSMEIVVEEPQVKPLRERNWRELIFVVWLLTASVVMVILLAVPPPPTTNAVFNLGLIPLGTGIMTMLVDTIFNRKYAFDAMQRVDWTVVLMFFGLFVWLGGFRNTCIPELLIDSLAPYMNLYRIEGVLLFTVIVALGSNIFSNVPLTILIVNRINEFCGEEPCNGPLPGLLLAWVATIAGNFTLIGSITNLIVAEKARSCANYQITFIRYIKFGFVSTICVMFGCLPVVYFLARVA